MTKSFHFLYIGVLVIVSVLLGSCQAEATISPPIVTIQATASRIPEALKPTSTFVDSTPQMNESPIPTVTPSRPDQVNDFPDIKLYSWQLVADGFTKPLAIVAPESNPQLFYILEQGGTIKMLHDGVVLPQVFLDIRKEIRSSGNEQGLLGMAIDPLFLNNGIFYLNYINNQGNTTISRFTANLDLTSADPASEQIILTQEQPYQNHNGGNLTFGPDGFLYIGFGDGGSAADPQGNAQNPNTLLGKMVRIAVQNQDSYGLPDTNPYVNGGGRPEIWAIGLRNPWRFSFDMMTGGLYIADVGQGDWEEIDYIQPDINPNYNFGWDYFEGTHAFEGQPPAGENFIPPVFEYDHSQGCSVTGGYVYRGSEMPDWNGVYFFGDYCSGKVWGLLPTGDGSWKSSLLFETGQNITSFGQDRHGEIYLVAQSGSIFKLAKNNN